MCVYLLSLQFFGGEGEGGARIACNLRTCISFCGRGISFARDVRGSVWASSSMSRSPTARGEVVVVSRLPLHFLPLPLFSASFSPFACFFVLLSVCVVLPNFSIFAVARTRTRFWLSVRILVAPMCVTLSRVCSCTPVRSTDMGVVLGRMVRQECTPHARVCVSLYCLCVYTDVSFLFCCSFSLCVCLRALRFMYAPFSSSFSPLFRLSFVVLLFVFVFLCACSHITASLSPLSPSSLPSLSPCLVDGFASESVSAYVCVGGCTRKITDK